MHTQATVGVDNRKWVDVQTSPGYARRGGFYAVTGHDFADRDSRFGFQQIDYEAVQHIPILRETWVLSLRGRAKTTWGKDDQQVPFYLLPSLGGGNSLRGYSSWRFRGRNSLLLQGEWRTSSTAVSRPRCSTTPAKWKSARRIRPRRLDHGTGRARFHTLGATVLRVELAHSREGLRLVFATSAAF